MHRWVEHTSELEVHIEAASERGVFEEATAALAELLASEGAGGEPVLRAVVASGPDRAALLAAWLEELVFLAENEGLVPESVDDLTVSDGEARGRVRGRIGEPAHLVKAVTYHRLTFDPDGEGWRATAILDV